MIAWGDLDARARGLSTHLLGRPRLAALATDCADAAGLAGALAALGYPIAVDGSGAAPELLELAVRRMNARALRVVARWAGSRSATLAIVFEDEDRRSLRGLVRGALQGAAASARLAGAIPTPSLPVRALGELARQPNIQSLATLLVLWEHPFGRSLLDEVRREQPDPLAFELDLSRTFAERATRAARRGGRDLRAYVRTVIDLENARTVLLLAEGQTDLDPERCLLSGGGHLEQEAFLAAARALSRVAASRSLATALQGTPYAPLFQQFGTRPGSLEAALLAAMIEWWFRHSRVSVLGPAPLLTYVLRLRAETMDLQRIIWGVALGVPPNQTVARLITRR